MWFAVNLLFESVHAPQAQQESLWEERLVLLQAETETRAAAKGELLGREEEHEYESATGDRVRWTFRRVERVYPIDTEMLGDGTELFSRFLRSSEVASLLTPFAE
ncbi:MAG TPA: DUF4288 domain-containing protein [Gemmataceae bacterium]|nr:DUF4288 domain-containing protein [Gemmataceae bacterium]